MIVKFPPAFIVPASLTKCAAVNVISPFDSIVAFNLFQIFSTASTTKVRAAHIDVPTSFIIFWPLSFISPLLTIIALFMMFFPAVKSKLPKFWSLLSFVIAPPVLIVIVPRELILLPSVNLISISLLPKSTVNLSLLWIVPLLTNPLPLSASLANISILPPKTFEFVSLLKFLVNSAFNPSPAWSAFLFVRELAFISNFFPVAKVPSLFKSPFISIFPLPVALILPMLSNLELAPVPFKLISPVTSIFPSFLIFSVTLIFVPLLTISAFAVFSKFFPIISSLPDVFNFSVFFTLPVVVILISSFASKDLFSTSPLPAFIVAFPPKTISLLFTNPCEVKLPFPFAWSLLVFSNLPEPASILIFPPVFMPSVFLNPSDLISKSPVTSNFPSLVNDFLSEDVKVEVFDDVSIVAFPPTTNSPWFVNSPPFTVKSFFKFPLLPLSNFNDALAPPNLTWVFSPTDKSFLIFTIFASIVAFFPTVNESLSKEFFTFPTKSPPAVNTLFIKLFPSIFTFWPAEIFELFITSPLIDFKVKSFLAITIPLFSILSVTWTVKFSDSITPNFSIVIISALYLACSFFITLYFSNSSFNFSISALSVVSFNCFSNSLILVSASSNFFSSYLVIKSTYFATKSSDPEDVNDLPSIVKFFPAYNLWVFVIFLPAFKVTSVDPSTIPLFFILFVASNFADVFDFTIPLFEISVLDFNSTSFPDKIPRAPTLSTSCFSVLNSLSKVL